VDTGPQIPCDVVVGAFADDMWTFPLWIRPTNPLELLWSERSGPTLVTVDVTNRPQRHAIRRNIAHTFPVAASSEVRENET
jgi:hypothetical protein